MAERTSMEELPLSLPLDVHWAPIDGLSRQSNKIHIASRSVEGPALEAHVDVS